MANKDKDLMMSAPRNIKLSASSKVFYVICYAIVAVIAVICLIPFLLLISGSFTAEQWISFHGFSLLPGEFSTEAYNIIFKTPERIFRAYGVSIFITAVGTVCGLLLTTITAYVISRKDFKYRNVLSFFFYFTTLFNGGMVSTYIFYIQYLHLRDNMLAWSCPVCSMFSICWSWEPLSITFRSRWWNPRNWTARVSGGSSLRSSSRFWSPVWRRSACSWHWVTGMTGIMRCCIWAPRRNILCSICCIPFSSRHRRLQE